MIICPVIFDPYLLLAYGFPILAGCDLCVLRVVPNGQIRRVQRGAPQNQEGYRGVFYGASFHFLNAA